MIPQEQKAYFITSFVDNREISVVLLISLLDTIHISTKANALSRINIRDIFTFDLSVNLAETFDNIHVQYDSFLEFFEFKLMHVARDTCPLMRF